MFIRRRVLSSSWILPCKLIFHLPALGLRSWSREEQQRRVFVASSTWSSVTRRARMDSPMNGSKMEQHFGAVDGDALFQQDLPLEPLLKKQVVESNHVVSQAVEEAAAAALGDAGAVLSAVDKISEAVTGIANGGGSQLLRVKKLSPDAVLPSRGSAHAAGYDLSSAHEAVIPARGKALVKTDLSIAVPEGTYGRVAPRSGLALKHGIDVGAGVIDFDYRGPLGVILFNHSDSDFLIQRGDRIAQLILEKICTPEVAEVEDLDATTRGHGGFGSTGVSTISVTVEEKYEA